MDFKLIIKFLGILFVLLSTNVVRGEVTSNAGNNRTGNSSYGIQSFIGKRKWVFAYQFQREEKNGLLDGRNEIPSDLIIKNGPNQYLVAPTSMYKDLHTFIGSYGISNKSSVQVGIRYVSKSMDVQYRNEQTEQINSKGLGDTRIGVTYAITQSVIGHMNLNLPTGNINQRGDMYYTSDRQNVVLPYVLQLGSGSIDLSPGVSYSGAHREWGWGAGGVYQHRFIDNSRNYRLGNRFTAVTWGKYAIEEDIELVFGVSYLWSGTIKGQDVEILQLIAVNNTDIFTGPMNNPELYGGQFIKFNVGFNTSFSNRHKVHFDLGIPIDQNVNGPQLKSVFSFRLGYQYLK